MSERASYAAGTPCWVDLGTPDQDAAADFYGGLFGWSLEEGPNPEETGGYRQAKLRGKAVAGVMRLMQEGQPPAWSNYISTDDTEATVAKVREAGGNVIAEPMDVMDLGRMALFTDPTGAFFGTWQAGTFIGSELVLEPGALAWNELNTRDPEAVKAFYSAVFGWDFEDVEAGEAGPYTMIRLGETEVGGMLDMNSRGMPAEIPAHWTVYFAVEDTDATIEKAKELGGGVDFGPIDIPAGRFAMVRDPHGAHFSVIALSEQALEPMS